MHSVDVVFVNYRSEDDLQRVLATLESAAAYGLDVRVQVIDCSGSASHLPASSGFVHVSDPGRNVGFGPAANLGAAEGTAAVVAFVNPDVELDLRGLAEVLRRGVEDRAVAWTGTLRNADGSDQRNAGPPPTMGQLAKEYLLGRDTRLPAPSGPRQVGVLTGAVLLVEREAFEAVGGFSAELPLYMEDVDLSRRLAGRGPVMQYAVELGVHLGGRSARQAVRQTWTLLHASRVRYYSGSRRRTRIAATAVVLAGVGIRAVVRDRTTVAWLPALARASSPSFPLAQLLPKDERAVLVSGVDVTVVVLALDEESAIAPTLAAARTAGFDVLVVDGGSTDGTVPLAERHGCQVVVRPFTTFSEQRNWALAQVSTAYVLFVDADELLHPALAGAVRGAVDDAVDGAWVPTLDYFAGRWMTHGGWYPQPHLRLLRREVAQFEGEVHERVRFLIRRPKVVRLDEPLLHRSHLSVGHYLRKLDRYTSIEADRLRGTGNRLVARGSAEAAAVLVRRLLLQRGWRDGFHGVVGAGLYAAYRFTMYAKAATREPLDLETPEAALDRLRRTRHH
ncbi:MAG TPA: glycosyltransferase [Acidimicrobiales bacterium]|nr:glycosyltransferase [Acidimicrobiales bacterium]